MKSVFWPCIDSNVTDTFKAQKGSMDISKVISKITLFNISSVSFYAVRSREYNNT